MELLIVSKWERCVIMSKSAKILKDKSSVGEWLSLRGKILLQVSAVLSPVVALSAVKSALILWPTNVVPMAANLFIGAMALAVVPGVTMLVGGRILEKRDSRKADNSKNKKSESLEASKGYNKQPLVVVPRVGISKKFDESITKKQAPDPNSLKSLVSRFKR